MIVLKSWEYKLNKAEILLQDFDVIISNTERTLKLIPHDKSDFRVHERSTTLGRLAMHCATMPLFGVYIIRDKGLDQATRERPLPDLTYISHERSLEVLRTNAAELRAAIAAADDSCLDALWCFRARERIILNQSRLFSIRFLVMNHLIHHVAQIGVNLRLAGAQVPALYGPSADEQFS